MSNTGGPAFPTEHTDTSGLYDGMTLRDYFAAKAMLGILTAPHRKVKAGHGEVASYAYSLADAMLEAREQK